MFSRRYNDLKNESDQLSPKKREDLLASRIATSINRILNTSLAQQHPHLLKNEVNDFERTLQ